MQKILTDISLASLPTGYHWDRSLPSFGIYIGTRAKTFLIIRNNGRREKIGRYPDYSLKDARRKAITLLNTNPARISPIRTPELIDTYIKSLHLKPYTIKEYARHLRQAQLPASISAFDTQSFLTRITQHSPSEGRHLFFAVSAFLSWCRQNHHIASQPLLGMKCPHRHTSRKRTLTDPEIAQIWQATPNNHFGRIIRLLILSGQRRGEITAIQKDWITKTLDFPTTKNGNAHTIPITPRMRSELNQFIPQHYNSWSKPKAALDKASKVSDWTLHDLRRTFATKLAELQIEPHIIESILNHRTGTLSPIARTYNRYHYLPQMEHALLTYDAHISRLISDQQRP